MIREGFVLPINYENRTRLLLDKKTPEGSQVGPRSEFLPETNFQSRNVRSSNSSGKTTRFYAPYENSIKWALRLCQIGILFFIVSSSYWTYLRCRIVVEGVSECLFYYEGEGSQVSTAVTVLLVLWRSCRRLFSCRLSRIVSSPITLIQFVSSRIAKSTAAVGEIPKKEN